MSYNTKTGKYISPTGRASFPVLITPKPVGKNPKPGAPDKYQLTLVFNKAAQQTDDYKDLRLAVAKTAEDKWGPKDSPGRPRKIKSPFLTIEDLRNTVPEGYTQDDVFIRLHSTVKPQVVVKENGGIRALSDDEIRNEIYPGCDIVVALDVFPWTNEEGGSGVSFGLGNVMKTGDNEPWGASQTSAADDFDMPATSGNQGADDDFLG